jgi:hypothetical protein
MMQEEKQLLLKDLCGRLPYGVKFPYHIDEDSNHRECDCVATMDTISEETVEFTYDENGKIRDWSCSIKEVKPYLRPMSSMTEEEKEYIKNRWCYNDWDIDGPSSLWREKIDVEDAEGIIDYFNEHHLDYRGLIPMGLALEAPEGMYEIG